VSADLPLTGDELATIKTRAEAATPGPWRYDPTKVNAISWEESVFAGANGPTAVTVASTGPADDPQSMDDAAYIAGMDPATTLRLVAEVERLRAQVERVEELAAIVERARVADAGLFTRSDAVSHLAGRVLTEDVPRLVAEVERLRAQVADREFRLAGYGVLDPAALPIRGVE
jgi:hypothetical protein